MFGAIPDVPFTAEPPPAIFKMLPEVAAGAPEAASPPAPPEIPAPPQIPAQLSTTPTAAFLRSILGVTPQPSGQIAPDQPSDEAPAKIPPPTTAQPLADWHTKIANEIPADQPAAIAPAAQTSTPMPPAPAAGDQVSAGEKAKEDANESAADEKATAKTTATNAAPARFNPFQKLQPNLPEEQAKKEEPEEVLVDAVRLPDPLQLLNVQSPSTPPAKPTAPPNPWLNLQQSRTKARQNDGGGGTEKPAKDPSKTLPMGEPQGVVVGYSKADRQQIRSALVRRETQIYTFPALMYFVELEFVRAMRYNRFFALLVMQVGFKSKAGPTRVQPLAVDALALLSTKIMDIKRAPDLLGHFDPAGLAIFMPDTDRSVANHFAARLAEMISKIEPAEWTEGSPLEFMIGVAGAPEDAHDLAGLIKEATKYPMRQITPS